MNKCEKCGFLHYRTDPCRVAKKSTAARLGRVGSNKAEEGMTQLPPLAGTQALPVDTNPESSTETLDSSIHGTPFTPSAGTGEDTDRQPKPRGRPRIHPDRKAAKAMYERNRRARMKAAK